MRSLGETIKDKRKEIGFSRSDLERETKIKKEFLMAIEVGEWEKLPEFPVVYGFVRSIAHVLDMDETFILSLLRRDYPKKHVLLTPKPDVKNKFIWSPKWTLISGVCVVALIIIGYLGYQYKQFISPPELSISKPLEGEVIQTSHYVVSGKTNPDASVYVNNQPALLTEDGTFSAEIEISPKTEEIIVRAVSRSGKETEVRRNIKQNTSD